MNVQEFFKLGMKRDLPELRDMPTGGDSLILNLGCGNSAIEGAVNLDYPDWDAEEYKIFIPNHVRRKVTGKWFPPNTGDLLVYCPNESVSGIHAYHFLEHLTDPRRMLREMQRVLVWGGVINIVVPHYSGSMAHQDLDHKHTFALDTWKNTFQNTYYEKGRDGFHFKIGFNAIVAIAERNTAILTQLIKE